MTSPLYWDADPVLLHFGKIPIHWYTALLLLGIVIAERVITHSLKRDGLPPEHAAPLVLYTLAGGVLGGHLGHVLFYEPLVLLEDPSRIFQFGRGLASHGAAIGSVLGTLVMAKRYKVDAYRYADISTLAFYCAIPLVRIGNFFNSEIYGRATDLPWGVVFVRRGLTEPRHPSQLYEALLGLAYLAFCFWIESRYRGRLKPGFLLFFMPGFYCLTRFFIEFVKEYQALSPSFPLTVGQLLSLAVMGFCAAMIWRKKLHVLLPERPPEPPAEPPQPSVEAKE